MTYDAKPVKFTQIDTADYEGIYDPEELLIVGDIPASGTTDLQNAIDAVADDVSDLTDTVSDLSDVVDANVIVSTALTAVPGSFADEAAVKAYLDTLVGEIKGSPYFS